jgi:PAS domain S-box-containing protein
MATPIRPLPGGDRALAGFTQAILDTAGEAIVSLDRTGIIRSFNRAAERMFGWSEADVIGRHVERLMPKPESTRKADPVSPYLLVGGPAYGRSRELVGLRRDGTRFPMTLAASQFDADDGPQFTWILRDGTDQAHLVEQLRHSQKLDAMGRLAGGVAHDFNNLLTVISGWCEALASAPADDRAAAVEQIASAAAKAASLTRQLLSFSRKGCEGPGVIDLNAVVDDVGRMLSRVLGEQIQLECVTAPTPVFVCADPGQIGQVLVNLALNARDAMPGGGRLRVTAGRRRLDAAEAASLGLAAGDMVTLTVRDTGTGISDDAMPHLFEPFFTTKAEHGTGLGLAMVDAIVHQAGGVLGASNVPDGGAEFRILLPEVAQPQVVEPPPAPPAAPGGSEIVLVVEDEAAVRKITASMLATRGYQVLQAATCQEALTIVTTHDHIDLLVTDVVMPDLSGPELATRIRTVHPDIRVLFVSGYSADAIARHGVNGAAPSFLQKPFTGNQLAAKVRDLMPARPDSPTAGPVPALVLR